MAKEPILRDTIDKEFDMGLKKFQKDVEEDKEKGFDINDIESIKAFAKAVEYTPLFNTVVVKQIREEQKVGSLILPDSSATGKKAVVIIPGMYVSQLQAGDIVTLQGDGRIQYFNRVFKGVSFWELNVDSIGGVFKSREVIMQRLKDENKNLRNE